MKRLSRITKFLLVRHRGKTSVAILALFCFYWFSLPSPLFKDPTCMVLEASNGELLGARIATDGQWRFPHNDEVPEKFAKTIVLFEDKRFYRHPGFDPIALVRAVWQNLKSGSIVSGGSTLSMQVIRLSRKGKQRTVIEKFIELVLATRLEISFSKKEILAFYTSNAPFGGNIVGLDAASWRYFGKSPTYLSWSETAALAVLPNSPSLIRPGKNSQRLAQKRNRLLNRLFEEKMIDWTTLQLALEEPLPDKPHPLPMMAPHLLDRASQEYFSKNALTKSKMRTTVDYALQNNINQLARKRISILKNNEIHNLAIIVLEVESGEVLAYVGNAPDTGPQNGEWVDIITAPRSTGSLLKPLLYAMMLQEGKILPGSLVPDIPTQMNGFKPENYSETYDGVISAKKALSRSLNVPFIRMLQTYGVEKFHFNLKKLGLKDVNKPPSHYGLTLVLGGAESSLWDMANVYAYMARTLRHFYPNNGLYDPSDLRASTYLKAKSKALQSAKNLQKAPFLFSTDAIWHTFLAMEEVERPSSEGNWERFESGKRVAWKTGTSFGFRDAWAIGATPTHVVGIWAGNADGEGRPGLVGVHAAAPILFDVFNLLPHSNWFDKPFDAMRKIVACKKSGYLAIDICEKDTIWGLKNSLNVLPCPYHKNISLDSTRKWQVSSTCENPFGIHQESWFVLPPIEEYYYKSKNPDYKNLPPFRPDCANTESKKNEVMEILYPRDFAKIYVPVDLDGRVGKTVFKIAHREIDKTVYWHIDREYIGSTTSIHEFELSPSAGKHVLTIVDETGNRLEKEFEILRKK